MGENPVAVADDGSPEWNCCSPTYEKAIQETIEAHNWAFDTAIATLVRQGASPDDLYTDAMAKPANSLSLIWVRLSQSPGAEFPADYKIIGNQICLTTNGFAATAKYTVDPQVAGTGAWPPLFTKIIRLRVKAAIFEGLREDANGARGARAEADAVLKTAQYRIDQDQPKRAVFNSRARSARLIRRPYLSTPFPWGGTGIGN
jgi:hypothetical protein